MANRYWVGGTGNWSDTAHWSASTGGAGGEDAPTSSDDVFIDANSGFGSGGTITLTADVDINTLTCNSGHTFTISGSYYISTMSSMELESGLTIDIYTLYVGYMGDSTLKTNGADITVTYFDLYADQNSYKLTLLDDLVISGRFLLEHQTFDADGFSVWASDFYFYAANNYEPVLYMGEGYWYPAGSGTIWQFEENGGYTVTIYPETSTINLSDAYTFLGGGKTYYNLWITGDNCVVGDSNTFNDIEIDTAVSCYFKASETQTITSLTPESKHGSLITLSSDSATEPFILSKSSGTVICHDIALVRSTATGGATWYAGANSSDGGGNSGWIFADPLSSTWSNTSSTPTAWTKETPPTPSSWSKPSGSNATTW